MSAPKSVLMLTASFYPHIGGTERQVLELSKKLVKDGWRVLVATRRLHGLPHTDSVEGVEVRRLFAPFSGLPNSLCFLVSSFVFLIARRADYEVIHVHLASSPALAACLAGKMLRRRVVVKIGGGRGIGEIAVSRKTFWGRLKLRLLAWFGPQLTVVDESLLAELRAGGLENLPCAVVPNGVDCEVFSPASAEQKPVLRMNLGILGSKPVFLFAGRLAREKLLGPFLSVWAKSQARNKAVLVIAGEGPLQKELKEQVMSLGLYSSVLFAGACRDMPSLYRAADVFVLPSVAEGLSNAMLESMACGLAVMSTSEGGAAAVLGGGEAGILFHPEDEVAINSALDRFISEPGLSRIMGEAARRVVERQYSIAQVSDRMKQIYSSGA